MTYTATDDDPGARPRRWRSAVRGAATCIVAASLTLTWTPLAVAAAPASAAPDPVSVSTTAIASLVHDDAAHVLRALPAGFPTTAGYAPVVDRGRVVDPGGSCSSPLPLPTAFDLACAAHDLGYDLLRYAADVGDPVGTGARRALDDRFARDLDQACATGSSAHRIVCRGVAEVAVTAVRFNTARQRFGTPVSEAPLDIARSLLPWRSA